MDPSLSNGHARAPRGFALRLPAFAVGLLLLVSACSGRHAADVAQVDEPIDECEAFLASYAHCLGTLGPAAVAQARVEQTRAAFAATHGVAPRAALRQKCVDNLTQLKTTCR